MKKTTTSVSNDYDYGFEIEKVMNGDKKGFSIPLSVVKEDKALIVKWYLSETKTDAFGIERKVRHEVSLRYEKETKDTYFFSNGSIEIQTIEVEEV